MSSVIHDEAVVEGPSREAIAAYYRGLGRFWHAVMPVDALGADGPAAVQLLGRRLVLARLDGKVVAFDDLCRHFGAALSLGEILDGCRLRCAYHGWTYDSDGTVVDIPARRGLPIPRDARVRSHRVREAYGLLWICMDPDSTEEIPDFPECGDSAFRLVGLRTYRPWNASVPRIMVANLDDTHFPWIHPGILGDREHPEAPDHRVWREGGKLRHEYTIQHPPYTAGDEPIAMTFAYHSTPNSTRIVKTSVEGTFVVWETFCPINHAQSLVFLHAARDFDLAPESDHSYIEVQDLIQEQDRPVVESQRPWLLPPFSSRLLLYVRPADLPLIEFQRWMEELGIPQL
jgi:phenylpropionate dioxygenase-like ring-hydroxylating dioxygenase large terminal subunit